MFDVTSHALRAMLLRRGNANTWFCTSPLPSISCKLLANLPKASLVDQEACALPTSSTNKLTAMINPRKKSSDGIIPPNSKIPGLSDMQQPLLPRPNLQRSNSGTQRPRSTGKVRTISPAIDIKRAATLASAALNQVRPRKPRPTNSTKQAMQAVLRARCAASNGRCLC